jgi:hypothetical protein
MEELLQKHRHPSLFRQLRPSQQLYPSPCLLLPQQKSLWQLRQPSLQSLAPIRKRRRHHNNINNKSMLRLVKKSLVRLRRRRIARKLYLRPAASRNQTREELCSMQALYVKIRS